MIRSRKERDMIVRWTLISLALIVGSIGYMLGIALAVLALGTLLFIMCVVAVFEP